VGSKERFPLFHTLQLWRFSILDGSCARSADNYLPLVQNINWNSEKVTMANKSQLLKKVQIEFESPGSPPLPLFPVKLWTSPHLTVGIAFCPGATIWEML
jgi:hypothetical protein